MKILAVAGLVLATALAGCTAPAPASEQLSISITDVGRTPYVIGVPLWLSGDGPNATEWIAHAAVHAGQVTEFHLNTTDRGTALWIAGNGTVTIGFADVRSEAGSSFADGGFSMGVGADGIRPVMFVQEGDVDVNWFYEAVSEDCFASGSYSWQADGPGYHVAEFGGRMTLSPDCPR